MVACGLQKKLRQIAFLLRQAVGRLGISGRRATVGGCGSRLRLSIAIGCRGLVICSLILSAGQSLADNGAFLFARPSSEKKIDGRFDDWGERDQWQTVSDVRFGRYLDDPEDAFGRFQMAYNVEVNAIFIAVEFSDNSLSSPSESWVVEADGFEIGLDLAELAVDSDQRMSHNYYLIEQGTTRRWLEGVGGAWREFDGVIQSSTIVHDGIRQFEWRIDVGMLTSGLVTLHSDAVIGFDLALRDHDEDHPKELSLLEWGQAANKFTNKCYGDAFLLEPGLELARFNGRLISKRPAESLFRNFVHLYSLVHPDWPRIQVVGDEGDFFDQFLPLGSYRVASPGLDQGIIKVDASRPNEYYAIRLGKQVPQSVSIESETVGQRLEAPPWRQDGRWLSEDLNHFFPGIKITEVMGGTGNEVWIGSNIGIVLYDGFTYTHYSFGNLPFENWVMAIHRGSAKSVWVLTKRGGPLLFHEGRFYRFDSVSGLGGGLSTIELEREGDVVFGGQLGITRFAEDRFQVGVAMNGIQLCDVDAIVESSQGSLWFTGPNYRLWRLWNGHLSVIQELSKKESAEGGYRGYRCFSADDEGRVAVGAEFGMVSLYQDAPEITSITRSDRDSQFDIPVIDLAFGRGGEIWSAGQYASRLHERKTTLYDIGTGLEYTDLTAVEVDEHGVVWIGTAGGAIARHAGANSIALSLPLDIDINCSVSCMDGAVWFGTESHGIIEYLDGDLNSISRIPLAPTGSSESIVALAADSKGGAWVAMADTVSFFREDLGWQHWSQSDLPTSGEITSLFWSSREVLWIGTSSGLMKGEAGDWKDATPPSSYGMLPGSFDIVEDWKKISGYRVSPV